MGPYTPIMYRAYMDSQLVHKRIGERLQAESRPLQGSARLACQKTEVRD